MSKENANPEKDSSVESEIEALGLGGKKLAAVPAESPRPALAKCELLTRGQECYCEGTGLHTGVNPRYPEPGDYWEFKLPGKQKRTKEVGTIAKHPPYQSNVDRPYVHWQRANKGRYTGISVERLMEFGRRVSTKAERDEHTRQCIERAKAKRDAKRASALSGDNEAGAESSLASPSPETVAETVSGSTVSGGEAPERIWVAEFEQPMMPHSKRYWQQVVFQGATEYVRADMATPADAEMKLLLGANANYLRIIEELQKRIIELLKVTPLPTVEQPEEAKD